MSPIYIQLQTNDYEEFAKVAQDLEDLGFQLSVEIHEVLRKDKYCVAPPAIALLLSCKLALLYSSLWNHLKYENLENRVMTYSSMEALVSFIVGHALESS